MEYGDKFRERFRSRIQTVDDATSCWLWQRGLDRHGYGAISLNGKMLKAHRVSWELENGDIPDEMCVCHHCDVPACVRPSHLFLGTHADNSADMVTKNRVNRQPRKFGVENGGSKITPESVLQIRAMVASGMKTRDVGALFGICSSQVSNITRRIHWRNV